MAKIWSRALDINVQDRAGLAAVFLAYAVNANPSGCVIFGSSSTENIRRNAQTAANAPADADKVAALLDCLAREPYIDTRQQADGA
jgi:aryl-alcohol dehydrogenase-like predicted oxidoreductase